MTGPKILTVIGATLLLVGLIIVAVGFGSIERADQRTFDRSQAEEVIPGVRNELTVTPSRHGA